MRLLSAFAFAAGLSALPAAAATLTAAGEDLGRVDASTLEDGLSVAVDLGGDVPLATHVIARFQDNQPLMLGGDGLWAPWDGAETSLDPAGFQAENGKILFVLLGGPAASLTFPCTFTIAYRTETGLKHGHITVDGP